MNCQQTAPDCTDSTKLLREFKASGFVTLQCAVQPGRVAELCAAYDEIMIPSSSPDFKAGSTTDRRYFGREIVLDDVYQHPLLLAISEHLIGRPVKLRSLLGRTVRAGSPAQALHTDVGRDSADAPVVGFILMLDAFTPVNGATRFIPGSQRWLDFPFDRLEDPRLDSEGQVPACGAAGSIIVFNASVWHGHTANVTPQARRSIQGYFGRDRADRKPSGL